MAGGSSRVDPPTLVIVPPSVSPEDVGENRADDAKNLDDFVEFHDVCLPVVWPDCRMAHEVQNECQASQINLTDRRITPELSTTLQPSKPGVPRSSRGGRTNFIGVFRFHAGCLSCRVLSAEGAEPYSNPYVSPNRSRAARRRGSTAAIVYRLVVLISRCPIMIAVASMSPLAA